jgi:hypothetical protein
MLLFIFQNGSAAAYRPVLSNKGKETEEEVDSHAIRSVEVNYHPGVRILSSLKDVGVKKVNSKDANTDDKIKTTGLRQHESTTSFP